MSLNRINLFAQNTIEENRLLSELHSSKIFLYGLIIRLIFIIFCFPLTQKIWFLDFINNSFESFGFDPWTKHINLGGDSLAFPYGFMMYIIYSPLTFIGWLIDQYFDFTYFSKIGLAITNLIFDYGILLGIAFLIKKYSPKLLLILYWFSPLVLYIFYWHGQLDGFPVFLLVWGIVLLQKKKPYTSGILLGIAISSKISMFLAFPFITIYLCRSRRIKNLLRPFLLSTIFTTSLCFLPFSYSSAFNNMVLRTPESEKLFSVFLDYGSNLKLFLLPTVYVLSLYLVWRLEKITLDLFLISVGLGFFVLLLLLPPAPGWFLWVIPFLVFYQMRAQQDYLLTSLPFYFIYMIYNLLYSSGADIHFFDLNTSQPISNYFEIKDFKIKSIFFTCLQATGLLVCVRMYLYGIIRNNYYQSFKRKLGIAIVGNQVDKSDIVINSFENTFGRDTITNLNVSDYFRWDKNHPMRKSKTLLHPIAYNLSRLTSDTFKLAEGKSILINSKSNIEYNKKIKSKEIIIVNGLHSLYIKRLRERLDLKIYYEIDENLKGYLISKKQKFNLLDIKTMQEKKDYQTYISSQQNFSDIAFRLEPVNLNLLKEFKEDKSCPKLKLTVTVANGFFHEELVNKLISLCGMHIDVEQSPHFDKIKLSFEGEANSEDVKQIASILVPNLEDLVNSEPLWEDGYKGLIQIIILVHVADILHKRGV